MNINYKILAFIWAFIILVLSITPGNYVPKVELELVAPDTIAHVVFYMILIFLILKWKEITVANFSSLLLILGSTLFYGFMIEVIQGSLIPGRFYDVYDILSNSVGSIVGLIVYIIIKSVK